ncbi:MAG: ABC transporter ATP-binding protein [Rubrimonas sp.]|uniref:ABC transporter ATP-binding protein n=1 Tax=Rubrimonas sp. TaxID=2036015 RepID=UPI002FDDABA3
MSFLRFEGVAKSYGAVEIVAPFDLDVAEGELLAFLGPSGCGKTTLMRMVGGLERPSSGRIALRGETLGRPDRRRGMVFQSYSAFPWLTVAGNVAYGMRYRRDLDAEAKRAATARLLALVGLTEFADAYPNRISGGMRQRVAIARTLAAGSEILLMDEPFGALDAQRRELLQLALRRIQREERKTVIFVTHDVEEAAFLADRVIAFSARPARILEMVDVAGRLGAERTLETRETADFFALRNHLLHLVRGAGGAEGDAP